MSDADFFSSLESAFAEAGVEAPSESPADDRVVIPDEVDEPGEQAVEEPEETPEEPPPAQEGEQPPADAVPEDPFANEIAPIAKDDKQWSFKPQHAEELMRANDFKRLIEQKIPGATPEMLERHYATQVFANQMVADLDSGDPDSIRHMADFVTSAKHPESAGILAAQLVERIAKTDQQAYTNITNAILTNYIDQLYREAIQSGDEDTMGMAQRFDYRLTGTYKTRENYQKQDPRDIELAQLRAEREARLEQERQQQAQTQQAWLTETDTHVQSGVTSLIEEALKPVAVLKNKDGGLDYRHMMRDLEEAVRTAFNANPNFKRQYEALRAEAYRKPSPQAREALIAQMKTFAKAAIEANRRKVIEPYHTKIMQQSRGAEKRAAVAAARQAPGGGPPATTNNGAGLISEGATFDESLAELFSVASTPPPRRR